MSEQQSIDKASVRKRGIKELIGGVVAAAVGGIVSYVSYDSARAGETYTVYYGIIAFGVVYVIKGLYDIAFPSGFGKKKDVSAATEEVKVSDKQVVEEED